MEVFSSLVTSMSRTPTCPCRGRYATTAWSPSESWVPGAVSWTPEGTGRYGVALADALVAVVAGLEASASGEPSSPDEQPASATAPATASPSRETFLIRPFCTARGQQPTRRSAKYAVTASSPIRSCCMVSRSRTVTAWSSSVSKSTVTQYGVPISSWRR